MSRPLRRIVAGRRLDEPQDAVRRPSTCRCPTRRRGPSISPGAIANETPSTACTSPPPPSSCEPTWKCLTRSVDLEYRRRSLVDVGHPAPGMEAGDEVVRAGPRAAPAPRVARSLVGARAAVGERAVARRARASDGTRPGISCSRPSRAAPGAGSRRAGRSCTGAAGARTARATGASSALRPAYMTSDAVGDVGDDAEVVRDQHDRGAEPLADVAHQVEDAGLDRHVERGRRLVGDQHLRVAGERHRDHHPLPHPAGELVRVLVDAALGRGDAGRGRAARPRAPARRARESPRWRRSTSPIWRPTGTPGSARSSAPGRRTRSRGRGSCRSWRVEQREQVDAVEERAARDTCRLGGSSRSSDMQRDALAAAGLADDAEHLALAERERELVDRLDRRRRRSRSARERSRRPRAAAPLISASSAGRGRRAGRRRAG